MGGRLPTSAPARPSSFAPMEQQTALTRLPGIYAALLKLREAGLDDAAIAARLDLEPEAVGPLVQIAAVKLAALAGSDLDGTASG
jgi:hypothetical protein